MKTKQSTTKVLSAENETRHSDYARLADAREIKFRAWNIPNTQMYFDVQNGVLAENENKQLVLGVSLGRLLKDAGSVIMQFTGLKDKNGTEIYEGDIVKTTLNGPIKEAVGFVWYNPDQWCFEVQDNISDNETRHWVTIEVIGNVFENHDLVTHVDA